MAKPRRFSAPFCFLRISSMTAWRSDLVDFLATATEYLGVDQEAVLDKVGLARARRGSLRSGWSDHCFLRTFFGGFQEIPAVRERQRRQPGVRGD